MPKEEKIEIVIRGSVKMKETKAMSKVKILISLLSNADSMATLIDK